MINKKNKLFKWKLFAALFKSNEAILELGYDVKEIVREIQEDKKRTESFGLQYKLDSNN